MSGCGEGSCVACRVCASERLVGGGPDGGAGESDAAATVALGKNAPRAGRISDLRAAGNCGGERCESGEVKTDKPYGTEHPSTAEASMLRPCQPAWCALE